MRIRSWPTYCRRSRVTGRTGRERGYCDNDPEDAEPVELIDAFDEILEDPEFKLKPLNKII